MKKVLLIFFLCMFSFAGFADEISCSDMQGEINALSARDDLSEEESANLVSLRVQYRKSCAKRAASRVATVHMMPINNNVEDTVVTEEYSAEQCTKLQSDIDNASDDNKETLQQEFDANCAKYIVVPELTDEEKQAAADAEKQRIADLRANGLCPDETKPNKFGCCAGERFKDIGNMEFACCIEGMDECLPLVVPVKE
ncbi:MAG: hypothetical protein KBS86_02610 [Proteobacteria bacterium]|nr:hypothetical protein [Candidatus Enterousia scatequi]